MELRLDPDEERAIGEATEWLMLLQDEPEDGDLRRSFEAWRAASPANAAAWEELRHLSDVAAVMQPAYATRWAPFVASRRAGRMASPPLSRRPWIGRHWALAVASVAAACALMVAAPGLILRLEADHLTPTAEQRRIELPDGSRVTLAPASAIAVSYEAADRRVRLLSGQAFFQVRPDRDRPFRVVSRGVGATVLGTSFDVRLDSGEVTVSVEEGIVRVAAAGAAAGVADDAAAPAERLTAGQAVRVSSAGAMARSSQAPQLVGAWRQGKLYVEGEKLGRAVDQLRRYFHGTILVTDGALAERGVTGAYDLTDPEHALRGMAQAHGATVRRITPWLLVLSGS